MASPSSAPLGVLLTNLGTPDAPTPAATRRYLKEFLWDPRVVEIPRPLWWLILNGLVLTVRPRRSAHAYQRVWTDQGSPLLTISRRITDEVQAALERHRPGAMVVRLAMRYGSPSIAQGLTELRDAGARQILVLPLYPQYSASTAASTLDAVYRVLKGWREVPSLRFVRDYHDDPGYIGALAEKIRAYWRQHGQGDRLVLSYHGLPQRFADLGDPYPQQCHLTSALLAEELGLRQDQWVATFQSRFGRAEWLKPYTDATLQRLGAEGVKRIDLACPGFSADCLETLEENAMTNRDLYLAAGGEQFHYIPCLNDDPRHVQALTDLVLRQLSGWL